MYTSARAFLQRPAAEALLRALRRLAPLGFGLLIHDAYRPWYVTRMFWDATPDSLHRFVANPDSGSKHNRGCAVDLSLYDLRTGAPVRMVGGYDEFSPRSYADYPGGTSLQRWYRALLRTAMEREGFKVVPEEWWHFDYKDWQRYPVLNLTFEQLAGGRNQSSPTDHSAETPTPKRP
jgi:D-alanyl-D-alanine dipeptidase